ncbi:MAG: trypsin-like serine peptidase [Maritimibacter sp.]
MNIRRFLRAAFTGALFCVSAPVSAGDSGDLRTLMTGDDSRGWEAVGRLDIAGQAFCTGALIGENIVLTAAHCMFDKKTGEAYDPSQVEFLAGWRNGRAAAYRGVRRAIVHPAYKINGSDQASRVSHDLALLELDQPIRTSRVAPFETSLGAARGNAVGVVSYAHDRAESPSLQETCHVLARQKGTLVMSCNVDYGSSGAPVFMYEGGEPRIVSVVSAKATLRDQPVALGTSLDQQLLDLRAMLDASDGHFTSVTPTSARLPQVTRQGNAGKFQRPPGS